MRLGECWECGSWCLDSIVMLEMTDTGTEAELATPGYRQLPPPVRTHPANYHYILVRSITQISELATPAHHLLACLDPPVLSLTGLTTRRGIQGI